MRAHGQPAPQEQRGRTSVYTQDFNPVSDSLGLTAIFAVLPDPDAVRAARRPEDEGAVGRADLARRGDARGDDRLRHAGRPDGPVRQRGRGVRPLPDHVDRRHGDLDLQHDRRDRPLRRAAALVRRDLRRPARPGRDHRVLLRRAARGARRLRHARGDQRGDADRARLPADQGRLGRARRQHRAGRVRRDRDPDHHAVRDHRPRQGRPRRDGRPPDALPRPDRAADPDRHGRRRGAASGRRGRWPWSAGSRSRSASSPARTTSRSSSPTSSPRCSRPPAIVGLLRVWTPGEPLLAEDVARRAASSGRPWPGRRCTTRRWSGRSRAATTPRRTAPRTSCARTRPT